MTLKRTLSHLFLVGLMGLTMSSVSAQSCDPGFVQADCADQVSRLEATGCSSQNQTPECERLASDLKSCSEQCIPQVTNGGILPGPSDGASARGYVLGNFLPNLTNGFLIFILVVAVASLMLAGFMWIFSSGNQETSERALNIAIWTIIGSVVGILAYFIVQLVININFFPA